MQKDCAKNIRLKCSMLSMYTILFYARNLLHNIMKQQRKLIKQNFELLFD